MNDLFKKTISGIKPLKGNNNFANFQELCEITVRAHINAVKNGSATAAPCNCGKFERLKGSEQINSDVCFCKNCAGFMTGPRIMQLGIRP